MAVESYGEFLQGAVEFPASVRLPADAEPPTLEVLLTVWDGATAVAEQALAPTGEPGASLPLDLSLRLGESGGDTLWYRVFAEGEEIYRSVIPFSFRHVLDLQLLPVPSRGVGYLTVRILDADLVAGFSDLTVEVVDQAQAVLQSYRVEELEGSSGLCEMDLEALPGGPYEIRATLAADGRPPAQASATLTKPEDLWSGAGVGLDDVVLPPWTPVEVSDADAGLDISVWGRTYSFAEGALPTGIATRGREILAAPLHWQAVMDGEPLVWTDSQTELLSHGPTRVVLRSRQHSAKLALEARTTIEYDGMIWSEVDFAPTAGATVESLDLLLPLKAEHFRYRQFPFDFMSTGTNDLAEGEEFVRGLPSGYCWIGDEERGLSWFFVRPGQFTLADAQSAVRIYRSGDTMTMRVRFLDQPPEEQTALHYAFGFQATPTRPLPSGWRMKGSNRYLGESWDIHWTSEAVTKYGGGHPEAHNPEYYQAMVDAYQRRGSKFVPYISLRWRDRNSPYWQYYRQDWQLPGGISNYSEERAFWHGHEVCAESDSYRDWLTYQIQEFVTTYGVDGLYHDLQWPYVCGNTYHGCEGGRRSIFGARELNRRVYAVLQGLGRPTIKIDHYSNTLCDPIASFSDAVVSGEEMCGDGMDPQTMEPWRVVDDYFKIPDIRGHLIASGMVGGQRGPMPWFLPEARTGHPEATRGLLALLLANDAGWTMWNGRIDFRVMYPLWRAARDFDLGADDVEFTGYWSADLPASAEFLPSAEPDAVPEEPPVVSIWSRGEAGALALVANYSTTQDAVAQVAFDARGLGLNEPLEIADAEHLLTWYPTHGTVLLPVRKQDYRLVWLRPGREAAEQTPEIPELRLWQTGIAGYMPPELEHQLQAAQPDVEIGRLGADDTTKFAQPFTFDQPVAIDHLRIFIAESGKARDMNSPVLREDELDRFRLNPPQIELVRLDEHGLPAGEVVAPSDWIAFSEARPGDRYYRRFHYDRIVRLEPGTYAFVISKLPESAEWSHTFHLASYPTAVAGERGGFFFDGHQWQATDRALALRLFGGLDD